MSRDNNTVELSWWSAFRISFAFLITFGVFALMGGCVVAVALDL